MLVKEHGEKKTSTEIDPYPKLMKVKEIFQSEKRRICDTLQQEKKNENNQV